VVRDDGTLGGTIDQLMVAFRTIKAEGEKIGLRVNDAKCELICNNSEESSRFLAEFPHVNVVDPETAILLGAPIGGEQSVDLVLENKLQELKRLSERLKLLSAHDAFFLLRNCFSLPKLQYTLRCSPCFNSSVITRYDQCIRDTLEVILNIQLSESAWLQASLPVAVGGIGVRTASQIALPAFLSSVAGSADLCRQILPSRLQTVTGTQDASYTTALECWKTRTSAAVPDPPFDTRQKAWDLPLVDVASQFLLSTAPNQAAVARLTAVTAPHAGAFLHAVPISAVGTRMDDQSLRIAIALRIGAAVCEPHQCICGSTVDFSGTHGLSCRKSAGRLTRHNAVNNLIRRALLTAGIPSRLEPAHLSRTDGKRPDGMTTMPWTRGQCLLWDFTCPDTLATSHLNKAVAGAAEVANEAEQKKIVKYSALSAQYFFAPVAIETLGGVGEEGTAFIQDLGCRIAAVTHEPRSLSFLWQRLSVTVQQGNAACILGTEHWAEEDKLRGFSG